MAECTSMAYAVLPGTTTERERGDWSGGKEGVIQRDIELRVQDVGVATCLYRCAALVGGQLHFICTVRRHHHCHPHDHVSGRNSLQSTSKAN